MKFLTMSASDRSVAEVLYDRLTMEQRNACPAIQALGFDEASDAWRNAQVLLSSDGPYPDEAEAVASSRPGSHASAVVRFGPGHRFGVYAAHTRHDAVEWILQDLESSAHTRHASDAPRADYERGLSHVVSRSIILTEVLAIARDLEAKR